MSYLHFEKQDYVIATLPDTEWNCSYSAIGLEEELNLAITGQRVKAIYVDLDGYLESVHSKTNLIDLSCMGGTSLIVFEKSVLQLAIHTEGMIEYRIFPIWDIRLRKAFDYPPEDMLLTDKYFYNAIKHDLTYDYSEKKVRSISVRGTNSWAFSQPFFNETIAEAAAEKNDLPAEIAFLTDLCVVRFVGDSIEYYFVSFESP